MKLPLIADATLARIDKSCISPPLKWRLTLIFDHPRAFYAEIDIPPELQRPQTPFLNVVHSNKKTLWLLFFSTSLLLIFRCIKILLGINKNVMMILFITLIHGRGVSIESLQRSRDLFMVMGNTASRVVCAVNCNHNFQFVPHYTLLQ